MAGRKRIPEIKLPSYPEEETTAHVVGSHILFIGLHYDPDASNPLEDCDGIGEIEAIDSRRHSGISLELALSRMWRDEDIIPLRFRDGNLCEWSVSPEADEAFRTIRATRHAALLLGRDQDEALEAFDPDWANHIGGIWTPDKCVRDSYTGQDGLSRRDWMVKQAEGACETYTDWCNGSVYGYDVRLYKLRKTSDGEPFDRLDDYRLDKEVKEDSCWGFYGWDYFVDEVKSVIKYMLKDLGYSRRAIAAALKEEVAA